MQDASIYLDPSYFMFSWENEMSFVHDIPKYQQSFAVVWSFNYLFCTNLVPVYNDCACYKLTPMSLYVGDTKLEVYERQQRQREVR